jgi:hypothetical protein
MPSRYDADDGLTHCPSMPASDCVLLLSVVIHNRTTTRYVAFPVPYSYHHSLAATPCRTRPSLRRLSRNCKRTCYALYWKNNTCSFSEELCHSLTRGGSPHDSSCPFQKVGLGGRIMGMVGLVRTHSDHSSIGARYEVLNSPCWGL